MRNFTVGFGFFVLLHLWCPPWARAESSVATRVVDAYELDVEFTDTLPVDFLMLEPAEPGATAITAEPARPGGTGDTLGRILLPAGEFPRESGSFAVVSHVRYAGAGRREEYDNLAVSSVLPELAAPDWLIDTDEYHFSIVSPATEFMRLAPWPSLPALSHSDGRLLLSGPNAQTVLSPGETCALAPAERLVSITIVTLAPGPGGKLQEGRQPLGRFQFATRVVIRYLGPCRLEQAR